MPSKEVKITPSGTDVDSVEPSLWNFIGQSKALSLAKCVLEQNQLDVMVGRDPKPPSVLLTGENGMGKSVLAKSIAYAFGLTDIRIGYGNCLGYGDDVGDYFLGGNDSSCFYIRYAEYLNQFAQNTIMKLLIENILYVTNPLDRTTTQEDFPNRLIIFSATSTKGIIPQIINAIDVKIPLTPYTDKEISQMLYQRCWMLNWACTKDTMDYIAHNAKFNAGKAMKMLQMTYRVARGRGEDYLRLQDATQALIYTSKPCLNKNDS